MKESYTQIKLTKMEGDSSFVRGEGDRLIFAPGKYSLESNGEFNINLQHKSVEYAPIDMSAENAMLREELEKAKEEIKRLRGENENV